MVCNRCGKKIDLTFYKMQEAFFIYEKLCMECTDLEVENYGKDEG